MNFPSFAMSRPRTPLYRPQAPAVLAQALPDAHQPSALSKRLMRLSGEAHRAERRAMKADTELHHPERVPTPPTPPKVLLRGEKRTHRASGWSNRKWSRFRWQCFSPRRSGSRERGWSSHPSLHDQRCGRRHQSTRASHCAHLIRKAPQRNRRPPFTRVCQPCQLRRCAIRP
jgi:hypothetical protein